MIDTKSFRSEAHFSPKSETELENETERDCGIALVNEGRKGGGSLWSVGLLDRRWPRQLQMNTRFYIFPFHSSLAKTVIKSRNLGTVI